jgi:hypothetical protein
MRAPLIHIILVDALACAWTRTPPYPLGEATTGTNLGARQERQRVEEKAKMKGTTMDHGGQGTLRGDEDMAMLVKNSIRLLGAYAPSTNKT